MAQDTGANLGDLLAGIANQNETKPEYNEPTPSPLELLKQELADVKTNIQATKPLSDYMVRLEAHEDKDTFKLIVVAFLASLYGIQAKYGWWDNKIIKLLAEAMSADVIDKMKELNKARGE